MINRHSLLAIAILLTILLLGECFDLPIRNLIPYAIAVGLITWKSGVTAGFIFSGLSILIAMETDAFPARLDLNGLTIYEYMYSYLKLMAVVLGVWLGSNWRSTNSK